MLPCRFVAETPRISILLPVRNAAATIAACLAGIRRQTESRFECVIVDDASQDDTATIVARFCRNDSKSR